MKKLILMRGASGSGKSTLAKKIVGDYSGQSAILSTDSVFMDSTNNFYLWSAQAIKIAHQLNQVKTQTAMEQEIPLIIIDNTNTSEWERQPYVDLAKEFGYTVEIRDSDTPWARNAEECFKRNSHNVPLEVIKKQMERL